MEVVAHERTQRTEGGLCNGRRMLQRQGLVGRQLHDALNRGDGMLDGLVGAMGQKHHAVREQMRLRCGDAAGQALQAGVAFQLQPQLVNIQGATCAAVIEGVGDVHQSHIFSRWCMHEHRARHKLVLGNNAR